MPKALNLSLLSQILRPKSARAETAGLAPTGVLLQSTIGKYFGDDFDVYAGFQREWSRTWDALSSSVKSQLSAKTLPLELSPTQWGAFIVGKTMFPSNKPFADELAVLDGGTESQLNKLKAKAEDWATSILSTDPIYQRVYQAIACDEIAASDNTDIALIGGALIGYQNPSLCVGRMMNHPFDSKNYQVSSPIFYLQGEHDPATTIENAKYHFENQGHGHKYFISVPLMGHRPIDRLSDCWASLWQSFKNFGDGIDDNIAKCTIHPSLQKK